MKTLEPFQLAGAKHLASNFHAALGDKRGLGKTVQALRAANMIGAKNGLVTTFASVRTNWYEHIEEEFGRVGDWHVVSYNYASDSGKRATLRDRYDVWLGDELQACKSTESKRSMAVLGPGGLASRGQYKWPLSGTFAPNHRPIEMFPMLKSLCPAFRDISYDEYTRKFCGAFFDGYKWNVKGAANLEEFKALLKGFLLERTYNEVYPDRKAPLITPIPVELSSADLFFVNSIEDEIGGREARLSSSFEQFSQLGDTSRLLRALGNAMRPHVTRFVDDLLAVEDKVVVFAHHSDVIDRLQHDFTERGCRPVVYEGGMSDRKKKEVVAQFQAPECRVFIGQRQAAGTGINGLQQVCSTMVLAEPSWVPGDTDQWIGRLDRIGQADPLVNAYVMYAKATLSAVVVGVHARKEAVGARLRPEASLLDLL